MLVVQSVGFCLQMSLCLVFILFHAYSLFSRFMPTSDLIFQVYSSVQVYAYYSVCVKGFLVYSCGLVALFL